MLRGLLIPGRCAERRHHQGPVGISSAATVEAEPAAYLTRIRIWLSPIKIQLHAHRGDASPAGELIQRYGLDPCTTD